MTRRNESAKPVSGCGPQRLLIETSASGEQIDMAEGRINVSAGSGAAGTAFESRILDTC